MISGSRIPELKIYCVQDDKTGSEAERRCYPYCNPEHIFPLIVILSERSEWIFRLLLKILAEAVLQAPKVSSASKTHRRGGKRTRSKSESG